jgi:hypothetical protein
MTTYADHAQVQTSGNDFLHYVNSAGQVLFAINSSGAESVQSGVATVGLGGSLIVYQLNNASLGFAAFNTAAAVNMLPTTVPTGTYRISMYMVPTTTFATSTEEVITFGWTDDKQAQTLAVTSSAESAGTITVASQLIRVVTGTAVTYTPSVTGSSATAGVMAISILVERVI